ncbi:MAG: 4Fe-4S dicluster domain-containing protein [Chromatiales bacterium]|jgi:molybdopterin-containing oxidoreductase family iron-sulfur binding subunit
MTEKTDLGRRNFITKLPVAAATATVASGVALKTTAVEAQPRAEAVTGKVRWGMLVDANKCADGCTACVDACNEENGLDMHNMPQGADAAEWDRQKPKWIRQVKLKDLQSGRLTTLPMMCQHCEKPPCADVCPTGASFRRADGVVLVDRHICIGCRYCMMACPYKARSFIHENVDLKPTLAPRGKGCVESCTFCVHRLDNGQTTTACQDACIKEGHEAIIFGDLNDPNSKVAQALKQYPNQQVRADLKLNPGVHYSGI